MHNAAATSGASSVLKVFPLRRRSQEEPPEDAFFPAFFSDCSERRKRAGPFPSADAFLSIRHFPVGRQQHLHVWNRSRQFVHAHSLQIENCFSVRLRSKLSAPRARARPPVVFSPTRRGNLRGAQYPRLHSLFRERSHKRCDQLPE
jgi:hypothetical protein